ncbi:hypothetical protein F5X98DRAFT_110561 [Xylaria grammica]|nr:hypothetical protein F5X98DRAFT_110561 [Xylaria grammica]
MPRKIGRATESAEKLVKEHGIEFLADVPRSKWPSSHKSTLDAIIDLGQRKFDSYGLGNAGDTDDIEPWKLHIKDQVVLLTEKVKRQRKRNESTWRSACEPIVFARLEAEVACRKCRKRVWRAEIEPTRDGTSSAAEALRKRRRNREPCRCPRAARSQDYLEAVGLNPIFCHREDEVVTLEPEVARSLDHKDRKYQKPDAIYGLRQTRNIENLLNDSRKGDIELDGETGTTSKLLREELNPSASLDREGDELLFPFLVVEAKAGKSDCEWEDIQVQTAFPIKMFLDTQNRLRSAAGRRSSWQAGPLVWFFANRGKDWRVSAAYIGQEQLAGTISVRTCYRVLELWRGSIDTRDGALQLLLLVDHVFAWARDIYREDIIHELRVLASGENDAASSRYSDMDIFSTQLQEEYSGFSNEDDNETFQEYIALQKAYTDLSSDGAVVRNAAFVENRYCCIYVTRDNLQTLLHSMHERKTQQLCRLVIDQMYDSFLLDLPTLVGMEEEWTGNVRRSSSGRLTQTRFQAVIASTNYLSEDWHQVRELFVIAIAEDAWDAILYASKSWEDIHNASRPRPKGVADRGLMLTTLKRLRAGTTSEVLLAAITRRAVRVVLSLGDAIFSDESSAVKNLSKGYSYNTTLDDGLLRHIVHHIYDYFNRGVWGPSVPFIQSSKRFDQQSLLRINVDPFPTREGPLKVSDDGCVMVSSSFHAGDQTGSRATICLYQVDGVSEIGTKEDLLGKIVHTIETFDVYHTTQENRPSNSVISSAGAPWDVPWNLQKTYGLYSGQFEYLSLVRKMNSDLQRCITPKTQGSMRESAESALHLLSRILNPWQDPRRVITDVATRNFVIYKIMTNEISFWKKRAAQRQSHESTSLCRLCEHISEQSVAVCKECHRALNDAKAEQWLYDAIVSKPSLYVNAYGGSDSYNSSYARRRDIWPEGLSGYPKLGETFNDMVELSAQCKEFGEWLRQKREARKGGPAKKRKRQDDESGEEEERTTNSDSSD